MIASALHAELPFASAQDFLAGNYDNANIRAKCVVKDAFRDEINPRYAYFTLLWDGQSIYAAVPAHDMTDAALKSLVGAEVIVTGTPMPRLFGQREKLGRNLQIIGSAGIEVVRKSTDDPFAVPDVTSLDGLSPRELQYLGRHKFHGRVLAVWNRSNVLLSGIGKEGMEEFVTARMMGDSVPEYGEEVDASGFPDTDLHHYSLVRAVWRKTSEPRTEPPTAAKVDAKEMTVDDEGRTRYRYEMHGKPIAMRGTVRSAVDTEGRFLLECDGLIVPVDIGANPSAGEDIEEGCVVDASGTCVMDIENWQINSIFPQIRGFFIVARTPSDVFIVARPPWWTTTRLLTVIGTLLAALAVILVWNAALRRVAAQKGQALFQEQIGRVEADLRTQERTRLAVELHDSLAQSLSGVSMELEAGHIDIAARTLKSCRDDLRDCLWDLRSQALEEKDMTRAVLRTLQPHVKDSRVAVRFNVPREKLSDNTAHALLRAVRELVVNAIRHGNASSVKVAGSLEDGKLLCSVTDNGCGFDPDTAPGVLQGHFGLQGISERIDALGGTFTIESTPGRGTKATIRI